MPDVPIRLQENAIRDIDPPVTLDVAVSAPERSQSVDRAAAQVIPVADPPTAQVVSAQPAVAPAAALESVPAWGAGPAGPLSLTGSWVMLAAARRELENPTAQPTPAAATSTGELVNPSAAAEQAAPSFGEIINYTFFHTPATADPKQNPGQTPSGTVTGNLNATTANGAAMVYSLAQAPGRGSVVIGEDGSYSYTPETGLAVTGGVDSFEVSIDNAAAYRLTGIGGVLQGIVHTFAQLIGLAGPDVITVSVPVTVTAITESPTIDSLTVSAPDAGGLVTGQISATDPEGSSVTYSAPAATPKGTVVIDSDTGAFTFTPTATARHEAARTGAPASAITQSVTLTATDAEGASASRMIEVAIAPANAEPVGVPPAVGTPDPLSGLVTGVVGATDGDDDQLTFSAPTATPKGSVSINAITGSFTYSPTAAAREDAARDGATSADRSDNFVVTVTDGYGGATEIPVTVAVAPAVGPEPTVGFTPASVTAAEGNSGTTLVPVTVRLSAPFVVPVTVFYSVVEQPLLSTAATPGVDFRQESGSVTVAAGQTEGTFQITVYGDTDYETDELVRVELTGATNAVVDANPSNFRETVTITNDDQPSGAVVSFAPGSVSAAEGDSGTTLVPVTVQLSEVSGAPVTVYYSVVEQPLLSTAATPWVDFRPESGSVTIPAGQTEGTLEVTVYGDTAYETDELVRVELTRVTGGVLDLNPSNFRETITITNDDQPAGPVVSFTPASVSAAEGDSGTTLVPVTVQLSEVSGAPVTVYYSVVEQPLLSTAATPWVDFRPESGSVTIPAGQTEGTLEVTVYGDTAYETDELVRVELTRVTGGVLDPNPSNFRETVTITNDDPAGAAATNPPPVD